MINASPSFQKHIRIVVGQCSSYHMNGEMVKLSCIELSRALTLHYFYYSIALQNSNIIDIVDKVELSSESSYANRDALITEIEMRTQFLSISRKEIDDIINIEFGEKGKISKFKILMYYKQKRDFIVL